jgi:hypothetical protein
MLFHEIEDDLLVGFEGFDDDSLVILHQAAVTCHVGAEMAVRLRWPCFATPP